MVAGPWRLDERDQVVPLNCLVPEDKTLLEQLTAAAPAAEKPPEPEKDGENLSKL